MKMSSRQNLIKRYFEEIIGFNNYIELRIYSKDSWEYQGKIYNFFSRYAKDLPTAIQIINSYIRSSNYNIYNGINPRLTEGKKELDVEYMKNLVFDMEGTVKQPFTGEYKKKLLVSAKWLEERIGRKFNCIVTSGRGLHCYISFKKGIEKKYKSKLKTWYDEIVREFNNNGIYGENNFDITKEQRIKMDKQVSDFSRILGTPFTLNTKYNENSAIRDIIVMGEELYDEQWLVDLLDSSYKDVVVHKTKHTYKREYNEKSIFFAPELRLLLNYSNVPEGMRYTNIILPIKMLMRDNKLENYDDVIRAVEHNGYKSPKIDNDFPQDQDYVYSKSIFRNWCFENWEWCVDNNYKIPEEFLPKTKTRIIYESDRGGVFKSGSEWDIVTWKQLLYMMLLLNRELVFEEDEKTKYDLSSFNVFIKDNLSEKLQKFVETNKLYDYLKNIR